MADLAPDRAAPDRRTRLADAALALVAEHGLKGLTHRAVDARADVPPGTTSNHFRTRAALVDAVVARLEQHDLSLWDADRDVPPPGDAEALADRLAGYLVALAGPMAAHTRVRFAVALELPEAVAAGHERFLAVARGMIAAAGLDRAAERAHRLSDYGDGMLFHAVTAPGRAAVDRDAVRRGILRLLG